MGAKPKDIGGGAATPVAGAFNDFLIQQLTGRAAPNPAQAGATQLSGMGGWMGAQGQAMQNEINRQQSNTAQPNQQATGFQNAFNGMLSGQVNDQSGAGNALQQYFQNPSNQLPTNFGNSFNPAQYQGVDLQSLPTNFGQGQTGMASLNGFGNAAQSGFNTQAPINSQFTGALQGLMGQGMQQFGQNGGFTAASAGPYVALQGGMDFGGAMNTLGQDPMFARNQARAIADTRARFGAEGAGSLGTGAQFAEGNLNAELIAQDASQRRAQAMQLMGQDLAERSTGANVGLQNRGQNMQTSIANMQGGLQGNQNQTALLNQMMGAAGQARGQDMQTQLGQLGLGSTQSMFNAGQQNDMQNQLMNATLQNQQMGNQFGLGAQGLNNAAMQSNNANNMNQNQFQNTFNQNNNQLSAQYGLGANQLNSQNGAQNQQLFQNMVNSGLNLNQLGNSNIQAMLGQLFGGLGQSNALGTAQRQTVMQPSGLGQVMNAGLGLGSAWLGGGGGNPFGDGQQMIPALPGGPAVGMTPGGPTSYGAYGSYRPSLFGG